MTRKILLGLLVLFVVLQFFRPGTDNADVRGQTPVAGPEVQSILQKSCYDCHSNSTVYPWYAHVQPVGWWLGSHIDEGREHLNFDQLSQYRPWVRFHKFEEIEEMVLSKEMPLPSYTILHRDAILTDETQRMIVDWAVAMKDSMKAWYPPDSLERRKRG